MILNYYVSAACRYQYTLQPTASLQCNPYTTRRLIIDCEITYSLSEQSANIQWVFVPDSGGSARTLSTDGVKYSISAAPTTGRTRSQLTVSSLGGLSDVGRYYCRGAFSNGTLLTRSQELTLFSQTVFDASRFASCSTFSGQSDRRTTCVLMAGQVAVGVTDPFENSGGPGNTNVGGTNNGGGSGGFSDTSTIVLAVVISAIVLFILIAVSLVTCVLLINCACESYRYGVS